ncbi:hypothetical protein ACIQGN_42140, partial [Streptomyces sp. NPDC093223]
APVESLMPLRLARYGVPLAQTAPEGLAAAGILTSTGPVAEASLAQHGRPTASPHERPVLTTLGSEETNETTPMSDSRTPPGQPVMAPEVSTSEADAGRFAGPYEDFLAQFRVEPTPFQWAVWLRDRYGISTGTGAPLSEDQVTPILQALQQRNATRPEQRAGDQRTPAADQSWEGFVATFHERDADEPASGLGPEPGDAEVGQTSAQDAPADEEEGGAPSRVPAPAVAAQGQPRVNAVIGDQPEDGQDIADVPGALTTVDRYYLAWAAFRTGNRSSSPTSSREAEELSAYLAERGMRGRGNKPVNPATLRRYLLPFRVYHVWAAHRFEADQPSLASVAQECGARGITGQYKRPITEDYLAAEVEDFERRWQALASHRRDTLDISVR